MTIYNKTKKDYYYDKEIDVNIRVDINEEGNPRITVTLVNEDVYEEQLSEDAAEFFYDSHFENGKCVDEQGLFDYVHEDIADNLDFDTIELINPNWE